MLIDLLSNFDGVPHRPRELSQLWAASAHKWANAGSQRPPHPRGNAQHTQLPHPDLPHTFESVSEESSQFDVLHGQPQEDGLVGTLKLVLPQREVVGNVIDGLGLLVPPD